MNGKLSKRPIGDWLAESIRVTAFLPDGTLFSGRDLWAELISEDPARHERVRGETTDQGPALNNWLMVKNSKVRADWILSASPSSIGEQFPSVGHYLPI